MHCMTKLWNLLGSISTVGNTTHADETKQNCNSSLAKVCWSKLSFLGMPITFITICVMEQGVPHGIQLVYHVFSFVDELQFWRLYYPDNSSGGRVKYGNVPKFSGHIVGLNPQTFHNLSPYIPICKGHPSKKNPMFFSSKAKTKKWENSKWLCAYWNPHGAYLKYALYPLDSCFSAIMTANLTLFL
jgi:hypothetical protein